jgi:predicted O-linked N-acetylglucosamine transferase (SPINDLY family)
MPQAFTQAAARARPVHARGGSAAQRAEKSWRDGLKLSEAQRHAQAQIAFSRAVRDEPGDALYWIHLARCELRLDHPDEALACAKRSHELAPGTFAFAQFALNLMKVCADYTGMISVLDRCAIANPTVTDDGRWQMLRCEAHLNLEQPEAAINCGMNAVRLSLTTPDLAPNERVQIRRTAALLLGHTFYRLARHEDAAQCYRMALDADPLAIGSALYAAHCCAWTCDWPALGVDLERLASTALAVQAMPSAAQAENLSPFCLVGLNDDPALMRWTAEHANGNAAARSVATPRIDTPVPRHDGRVRLGMMSSDFHQHATSILLVEALEHIDRSRFELYLYSSGPDDHSPLRQRILATATIVHDTAEWSGQRMAEQMHSDRIGVLIDLKGSTTGARLDVIQHRPAPVQVAWLGFPGTGGSAYIDYVIGDPVVTPLEKQGDYTEAIAQMPLCYQPNDSQRSRPPAWRRERCGLPEHAVVLASFNQPYKITPDIFSGWCEVMLAVPDAVLWLMVPVADTQERLRAAARTRGIASERLVFAPFIGIESHRARLQQADLVLDTFPCGGHTTASDALWAGVPVITRLGESFPARVAASLLHAVGLDELICSDHASYVQRAIDLATDAEARLQIRRHLESEARHGPLFDGARFAADLQQLLDRIIERQDQGLAPASLAATLKRIS